jgi:formylglycine-generating enzyme required for sulfatase activity
MRTDITKSCLLGLILVGLTLPLAAQSTPAVKTVVVEGGTFQQGARTLDPASPGKAVTVSTFLLAETVVTQSLWATVVGTDPSRFKGPLNPVERVSWFEAVEFCNRLSALHDLPPAYTIDGRQVTWDPQSPGWRLPTEAEFEFAARGGLRSLGFEFPGSNAAEDVAWGFSNSQKRTHVVKELPPNELGLYGMAGNVWQWCWDWYTFDRSALPSVDPRGPATGSARVSRGGAWNEDHADAFRPYYRADDGPETQGDNLGFRLARNR